MLNARVSQLCYEEWWINTEGDTPTANYNRRRLRTGTHTQAQTG
jgi:hypothetical protein